MSDALNLTQPLRPRTKEIIDPNYPLLEANRSAIESIERRTFTHGSTEVHKLDVYYPQSSGSDTGGSQTYCPILVFFYGGGYVRGSRCSPPSNLVHNNLGAFFASKGILTVIPDYRLVPTITYPQGSEDVRDALEWVEQNLSEGNPHRMFILAHSAGGLHLADFLLSPSLFLSSPVAQAVRGVIFMGVPYEILPSRTQFYATAQTYYGDKNKLSKEQPLSLLRHAENSYVAALPPVRNIMSGSEPRTIKAAMQMFTKEFQSKGGVIEEFILEGHDHLSPILALSSGSGEEWGYDTIEWMSTIIIS